MQQAGGLGFPTQDQAGKFSAPAMDPPAQFLGGSRPIALRNAPPQRGGLQTPTAEIEGKIHDGGQSGFRLNGQHWTVAQGGLQGYVKIIQQVLIGLCLRDRRVRGLAQMPIPDGPKSGGATVGIGVHRIFLRHPMQPLEAFGQIDGELGKDRRVHRPRCILSSVRPKNQKFKTPAHSA